MERAPLWRSPGPAEPGPGLREQVERVLAESHNARNALAILRNRFEQMQGARLCLPGGGHDNPQTAFFRAPSDRPLYGQWRETRQHA